MPHCFGLRPVPILAVIGATAVLLAGCGGHDAHRWGDDGTYRWTILLYMAADNNLEQYAIQDVNELELVGSDANVSVIVQLDRASGYDNSNGDWTSTRRYYVTRDLEASTINSTLLSDLGELDMSAPETLSDFVRWGMETYPADHYVLVLWDHGRGWQSRTLAQEKPEFKAIFVDQYGHEMNLAGLQTALSNLPARLDVALFDSCLMGMLEVAYAIRDSADSMVASEDNVPAAGQQYQTILRDLESYPGMTPREFSANVVSRYVSYYSARISSPVTLSAIDLNALSRLSTAADGLASAVIRNLNECRSAVQSAQQETQYFDTEKLQYTQYRDLYDFARLVRSLCQVPQVRTAADDVMSAVTETVFAEQHTGDGVTRARGVSIYLPNPGQFSSEYPTLAFCQDTSWDEMVAQY